MATASQIHASAAHATPSHKWLVALAVMLGTTLEVLDTSIVNVALPHMQGAFSAGVDEIAWVLTSYLVANGIMIPMTAWISSRFGRKRYFLTSVFAFVAASALCGAAQSLSQMIGFRLIQGAAGAAMIPSSQAILMETFPPDEQQMAMALWGVGLMVAPILGPTVGGWITDNWNWRWNLYPLISSDFRMLFRPTAFAEEPNFGFHRHNQRCCTFTFVSACIDNKTRTKEALGLHLTLLMRGTQGYVTRITPDRFSGIGPWAPKSAE
jgi:DHA2 family multidrug resistance protein